MTYVFANTKFSDYREIEEDEAKSIIEKYGLKLKGVTYMSDEHPNIMVWKKKDTEKTEKKRRRRHK